MTCELLESEAMHLPEIFGLSTFAKMYRTVLLVKFFLKMIPTFDVLFPSKPKPKVLKLSTYVENVENIPEFLEIPVYSGIFSTLLTHNSGIFFDCRHHFWPFDKCRKCFCNIIFDFHGIISPNYTGLQKSYRNAQPLLQSQKTLLTCDCVNFKMGNYFMLKGEWRIKNYLAYDGETV